MQRFQRLWNGLKKNSLRRFPLVVLVIILCFTGILPAGCAPAETFDSRFKEIVRDYRFSLVSFHLQALGEEINKLFTRQTHVSPDDTADVVDFFSSYPRNEDLREQVELVLEAQVREAFQEAGIFNPFPIFPGCTFPPVNFYVDEPPLLLVVSPRDRIDRYREALLIQDMTLQEVEQLEEEIEALGYSALVLRLGGVATYPSYVSSSTSLPFALDIAAEEWLHQYLAFTPLGFRYVLHLLGIKTDNDIVTMNETAAGIISKEISEAIYARYYADPDEQTPPAPDDETKFDFSAAMRETRLTVDGLLAAGEIEAAEAYMAQRRDYIQENGYYIRKLNQAYFAFHGSYADSPSSVDPIGEQMQVLRAQSSSLKEYLDTVAGFTGVGNLEIQD